jgi:hypothetical protein
VVSWYVMIGIGQVVTLRLPASRLREVNRILENTAWGSYRTEFHPTYDYKAIGVAAHEKAQQKQTSGRQQRLPLRYPRDGSPDRRCGQNSLAQVLCDVFGCPRHLLFLIEQVVADAKHVHARL